MLEKSSLKLKYYINTFDQMIDLYYSLSKKNNLFSPFLAGFISGR
jgi:hypothetical protein